MEEVIIGQLQQLIDINMLLLKSQNPELATLVDRVHNELDMFMIQDWEEAYKQRYGY